jgi:hypothetical protein
MLGWKMNNKKVLTYSNAEQLYASDSIFMKKYNDAIHITATSSLRRALVKSNSRKRWINAPIISFGQLVKNIGYGWFSSKTMLKQMIELTKIYNNFVKQQEEIDKEVFKAFDRNQQEVYSTMRALVEAAYTSRVVLPQTKLTVEENIFFELFSIFEKHKSVIKFRKWFNDFYKGKENLLIDALIQTFTDIYEKKDTRRASNMIPKVFSKKEVNDINLHINKNEQEEKIQNREIRKEKARRKAQYEINNTFKKKRTLVFHGFYFVTPVQQLFFKGLERLSNIEVVHLIHYDKDYPQIFETVERFLDLKNAQKVSDSSFPINTLANKFANSLAGDQTALNIRTKNYHVFSHIYQFKDYIEQDNGQSEEIILSPRANAVEKYVSDLESTKDAKLKDYPIGQFLLDLHRFSQSDYNVDNGEYDYKEKLNNEVLIRLFNSGYLYIPIDNGKVINGQNLVESLIKLEPIVRNCVTFNQWENTLRKFIERKQSLQQQSKEKSIKTNNLTEDMKLYIYEHQTLAYFNVTVSKLELLLKGIYLLKEFYELAYEGERLSISKYIEKLQEYMDKNVAHYLKDENEKKLTKVLLRELNELKEDEDFEGINRRDIIKGLSFFLSKKDEDVTLATETVEDSFSEKKVRPLVDGDGIIFEDNRDIHLAFMDNMVLPVGQTLSLWPIKEQTLYDIIQTGKTQLHQLQIRKEMTGSISAYLIYIIMEKATKITISYSTSFEDEVNLYPSFYIQLLELNPSNYNPVADGVITKHYNASSTKYIGVTERNKSFILDKTAYACQRRFVFSYLLQKRPDFESDFHHQFIYTALYSYYRKLAESLPDTTEEEIVNFINSMFPQWTDTKKKMMLKQAKNFNLDGFKIEKIDDIKIKTSPRPITLIGLNKNDYYKKPTNFITNSNKCMYCPFALQCREAGELSVN